MGITVHFEGRLRDDRAYTAVVSIAESFAAARGWSFEPFSLDHASLKRVKDEEDWDYEGPTKGVELRPHPNCEPLRLEFDESLYVQEYTKTQFAPIDTHKAIVALLHELESYFAQLDVFDESEYFETGDEDVLRSHLDRCAEEMDRMLAEDKTLTGPVRLPGGRIADLIRDA